MKLKFTTSNYFEGFFIILGYVFLPIAIYLFVFEMIWLGIIFILLSFIILTTKYKLEINGNEKYYKEYLWIFGFENGEKKGFDQVGAVIVKPEKYVQRINSIAYNKEIRYVVFAVYIRIDNEDLFAGEFRDKEKADARAKEISSQLNTVYYA